MTSLSLRAVPSPPAGNAVPAVDKIYSQLQYSPSPPPLFPPPSSPPPSPRPRPSPPTPSFLSPPPSHLSLFHFLPPPLLSLKLHQSRDFSFISLSSYISSSTSCFSSFPCFSSPSSSSACSSLTCPVTGHSSPRLPRMGQPAWNELRSKKRQHEHKKEDGQHEHRDPNL